MSLGTERAARSACSAIVFAASCARSRIVLALASPMLRTRVARARTPIRLREEDAFHHISAPSGMMTEY